MSLNIETDLLDIFINENEIVDKTIDIKLRHSFKDIIFEREDKPQWNNTDHDVSGNIKLFMEKLNEPSTFDFSTEKQSEGSFNASAYPKESETSEWSDGEESNKNSKSKRKPDNKKNLPGLVRDRVLTGIKKIVKTSKYNSTFEGMKRKFLSMKEFDQARLKYIFDSLGEKGRYSTMKNFLTYLKGSYNKNWKQFKTWKKFKEFLTIPEYQNAGIIFKDLVKQFIFGDGKIDQNAWLENFKGKEYIKHQLSSKEFKSQMRQFIESL